MPQIVVENLIKAYQVAERRPGLWGAIAGVARPTPGAPTSSSSNGNANRRRRPRRRSGRRLPACSLGRAWTGSLKKTTKSLSQGSSVAVVVA